MQTSALRPLTLGEVLDVAFGLYRSRFSALVTIALASQSLPLLLGVYVESAGGSSEHPFYYFGVQVLALVAATIGTAACTFLISDTYLGVSSGAAEALARAMPLIGRLVMVSIMVGLLVFVGFMLLIVPGCILLGGLWVSSAVAVVESPPSASAALSRAWKLSEGFRGKVLLTMLTGLILFLVPSLALGVVAAGAGAGAVALGALVSLLQVLLYPFLYVLTTVLYYDLRVRKEGFDLELLASALQPA
jgi:hypothetical protein